MMSTVRFDGGLFGNDIDGDGLIRKRRGDWRFRSA